MAAMSEVMRNNKQLHYLLKNMGAVFSGNGKCQEMHICEFADNYKWVYGAVCGTECLCTRMCEFMWLHCLRDNTFVYSLFVLPYKFCWKLALPDTYLLMNIISQRKGSWRSTSMIRTVIFLV